MADKAANQPRNDFIRFAAIVLTPTLIALALGILVPLYLGGDAALAGLVGMAASAFGMLLGVLLAVHLSASRSARAIASNLDALASADPGRVHDGLRGLAALGPTAQPALPEIERLCDATDSETAGLARAARAAIAGHPSTTIG